MSVRKIVSFELVFQIFYLFQNEISAILMTKSINLSFSHLVWNFLNIAIYSLRKRNHIKVQFQNILKLNQLIYEILKLVEIFFKPNLTQNFSKQTSWPKFYVTKTKINSPVHALWALDEQTFCKALKNLWLLATAAKALIVL